MSTICSPHQIVEKHVHVIQFFLKVPHGVTPQEVLDPASSFWANAWKRFEGREGSTVDFLAEDGSWDAEARVLKVDDGKVHFRILRDWREPASDIEVPKGYRVEFIAEHGWRAIDPAGTVVADRRPAKTDVLTAALDHATAYAPKRNKAA